MPDPINPASTPADPGGQQSGGAPGEAVPPGSESAAPTTPSAAELELAAVKAERDALALKNREIIEEKRRKTKEAADAAAARGEFENALQLREQEKAELAQELESFRPMAEQVKVLEARLASQDKVIEGLVTGHLSTLTDVQKKAIETTYPDWKQLAPMDRLDRLNRYTEAHGIRPGNPGPDGRGRSAPSGRETVDMSNPGKALSSAMRGVFGR